MITWIHGKQATELTSYMHRCMLIAIPLVSPGEYVLVPLILLHQDPCFITFF